jgi:hypothetical protein
VNYVAFSFPTPSIMGPERRDKTGSGINVRIGPMSPTNIFAAVSTPAQSIFGLSIFVFLTVAAIFIGAFSLLAYAAVRFRNKQGDDR